MADEFTKAALYGIKTFNKKVKEKIGMQKLIELLNEYENQLDLKGCTRSEQPNFIGHIKAVSEYSDNILYNADLAVTSKRYGFIKWLVENDKIDVEKIEKRNLIPLDASLWHKVDDTEKNNVSRLWTTKILMLLSISNSPIDDLLLYLK